LLPNGAASALAKPRISVTIDSSSVFLMKEKMPAALVFHSTGSPPLPEMGWNGSWE
jgi:hypothetical protein